MTLRCDQINRMSVGETLNAVLDCTLMLTDAELLTGTPTVTVTLADGTASVGVTLASKTVNSAALENEQGDTIAIGKAVQWSTTGVTAGMYLLTVTTASDASPAQTIKRDLRLNVG